MQGQRGWLPWKLRMCDPRYSVWEVGSYWRLCSFEPWYRVWEVESDWRLDMRPHVHGLGSGSPWRWWRCDLRYRVCEGVYHGDCGHVTPGTGSMIGCQPEDSGLVTPGAGSGRRSPWRFWTSYSRYSLWVHLSPYRQWKCDPRCRFRKGTTGDCEFMTPGAWS